ncbi:hypothetical protein DV736_g6384, partial [Chaetothyriales sp. CBS 134916]
MGTYILVTGANSGLGLGICTRLIDDFLQQKKGSSTAPKEEDNNLTVIFTTRSRRKSEDTLAHLTTHLRRAHPPEARARIRLQAESVELTSLLSVQVLAQKLLASDLPHLDAVICNAGIGGWTGLNWPLAVWTVMLDIRRATTWPEYKLGAVGLLAKPQLPSTTTMAAGERPLGEVFCANVFGHYMLAHWLMPLLWAAEAAPSKVVWVSSVEAGTRHYNADDHQGLRTDAAYEHSKRLTDLLALTAQDQPATAKLVDQFVDPTQQPPLVQSGEGSRQRPRLTRPRVLVTHPGVATTSIISLSWILAQAYVLTIYLTRWVGGVWSTVSPYLGAASVTWAALALVDDLRAKEAEDDRGGGEGKWGTAIDRFGVTTVRRTEAEDWGINGSGKPYSETWWGGVSWLGGGYNGRRSDAVDASKEDVENFVTDGAEAWRKMEQLRAEWEARLDAFDREVAAV